ncbi:MAG: MiaB/RimO family radical SAM methylthiotransferase, partial [Clostridiales bacterium]|nr:MiaB/RimO family radical SAM methylthiotransferase [Clostridiales bacterium]
MLSKTVAMYTLGCKVNQAESQAILDEMRKDGWQPVPFQGPASLYIVNTCTVTGAAEQKSAKVIRGARKYNPGAMLAVIGCSVEADREAKAKDAESAGLERAGLGRIDLLAGNGQKGEFPAMAEALWQHRYEAEERQALWREDTAEKGEEGEEGQQKASIYGIDRTRAMMKVQDGCRQFCSYCIIPYVRRAWESMPIEEAVLRTKRLVDEGYRETVLLGIHLGAYGQEEGKRDRLAILLDELLGTFPMMRFRLGSVEPMEASDRLIQTIRDHPNACKHLHLPLQSGSDAVLQAMGRPYTTAAFRGKIESIRQAAPEIALTTDMMVGFPGEGEEEHSCSLAFAEEMAFSRMHVFAYSRRPGTPAAGLPRQVAKAVKDRRSKEMIRLGRHMQEAYGQSQTGQEL